MTTTPTTVHEVVVSPNVFKQIRTKHGLSLEDVARRARVSKQAIIRLEQGTYVKPLPAMLDWWHNEHGYSLKTLTDAYEGYRENRRRVAQYYFGSAITIDVSVNTHPLRQLRHIRSDVTLSQVAKDLCIPQATLQFFERKYRTQQSVPKELTAALLEVGYTSQQVRGFSEQYVLWRRRMLNKTLGGSNV